MKVPFAVWLCAWSSIGVAQIPASPPRAQFGDFLLTEKLAYVALPPIAVGESQIAWLKWSPSGRYLLMAARNPRMGPAEFVATLFEQPSEPEYRLFSWDRRTGKSADLGTVPIEALQDLRFFGQTDVAFTSFDEEVPSGPANPRPFYRVKLLLADAAQGTQKRLTLGDFEAAGGFFMVHASPTRAKAIVLQIRRVGAKEGVTGADAWTQEAWTIDPQGRATPARSLGKGLANRFVTWYGEGNIGVVSLRKAPGPQTPAERIAIDVGTGEVVPVPAEAKPYGSEARPNPFELVMLPSGPGETRTLQAWLQSTYPTDYRQLRLASDVSYAEVNATFDAVAVLSMGVATVVPLSTMPKDQFEQVRNEAAKRDTISRAKQVGTAIAIFMSDHDDRFPTREQFDAGELYPYTKNSDLMKGFVYLMNGQDASRLNAPAQTVIGYIPGPGGYAWVFADTHVQWNPGPPP